MSRFRLQGATCISRRHSSSLAAAPLLEATPALASRQRWPKIHQQPLVSSALALPAGCLCSARRHRRLHRSASAVADERQVSLPATELAADTGGTDEARKPVGLYFFSDATFRPLRDQFVASVTDTGFEQRETYVDDLGVDPTLAAGGPATCLFKIKLLAKALEDTRPGDIFVYSDIDVQFFGDLLPCIRACMRGRDMCFLREFHGLGINSGIMAFRRSDATSAFLDEVRGKMERDGTLDQKAINGMLYTLEAEALGLRWGRLPPEVWASSQAFDGGPPPPGILAHHANWTSVPPWRCGASDPSAKVEQLAAMRRLVRDGDRAGQAELAAELAADPSLRLYFRRSFGDKRSGPEWRALPETHPARKGGPQSLRRSVKGSPMGSYAAGTHGLALA